MRPTRDSQLELTINGGRHEVTVAAETPLLAVLRGDLGLSGPKEGCTQEQCYACAVLVDGRPQPSCQLPVERVAHGATVTTVEGIEGWEDFFVAEQAGQCGYCLAGMIVSAQGLLNRVRYPSDEQIRETLDTNLCRCGVYERIRRAIKFRIGQPESTRPWEVRPQSPLERPAPSRSPSIDANSRLDQWLSVDLGGTVTVRTGKCDLGQGISTALAQIAASELSLSADRIRMVAPDTYQSPDEGVTSGSFSMEHSGSAIRLAAATARQMLLAAAAARLGADVATLSVEDGTVTDRETGASVSYWELQGGRPFGRSLTAGEAGPAHESDVQDGAEVARLDLPPKLVGEPSFIHDLRLPATVHGRVVRPPGPGAELESIDAGGVESLPGVIDVVRDGSFLAVIAEREDQALTAAEALAAATTWIKGPALTDAVELLSSAPTADYFVVDGTPIDDEVEPIEPVALSARYSKPLTMHASLGPSAAVAWYVDETLTIWSATQGVFPLRDAIAEALSLGPERVRVIHVEGAGCYGHNGADDVSFDAALLAVSRPGRPVSVKWSRADEHRWEPYSPAMIVQLGAVVDDGGSVVAFESENWSTTHTARPRARGDGASGLLAAWHREHPLPAPPAAIARQRHMGPHRNSDPLYAFERKRIQTHLVTEAPVRTSATRSLGAFTNVFAIESFMDELATTVGADPVEYRLRHLRDQRAWAVLEAAAEASGWGEELDYGIGQGLAFARYKNAQTYLAVVVTASVSDATGQISIAEAVIAADAGRIVSPDGVSNQLEGGCVQAASWTLKEQVRIGATGIESDDWETYPILRFSESFPIRTVLLDRPDQPSLGCGEAAQGPTAAAIANAVFHATGQRLRGLPLTPERLALSGGR